MTTSGNSAPTVITHWPAFKNPNYAPKNDMQKLAHLIEECGEVLAAAGKTLRWGLDSVNPELPQENQETNRDWLLRELLDLDIAITNVRAMLSQPPLSFDDKIRPEASQ